jgi:transcriptional regulator with XRE-family HTH domain
MTEPADRLRELRARKGFSTAIDAARAFGWNEHTYKSHENAIRGIRLDAARKYAAAYNSSAAFILTGQVTGETPEVNSVINVPVVARVSAGAFRDDEGLEIEGILVPAVPRRDIAASLQYSVLIDGPSVNKRIPDGAYAICAPYASYPGGAQHGQLVHVVRERSGLFEHTIKELRYTATGSTLVPVSTDPKYQDAIRLDTGETDEIVRIQGVVIGTFQPF